jgi:hypothetical protein
MPAPVQGTSTLKFCIYVDYSLFSVGHVFVQLEDPESGFKETYGHYPAADRKIPVRRGPGVIHSDNSHGWDYKVCWTITADQWNAIVDYINNEIDHPSDWSLFSLNCVDFAAKVAMEAGIMVDGYINRLGIPDPYALGRTLDRIGNGGAYHGGTVTKNTLGVPPSEDPPGMSVEILIIRGLQNATDLASFFSLPLVTGSLNLPDNLYVGETFSIQSPVSNDLSDSLAYWDFGDGTWDFNTTATSHAYGATGTYTTVFLLENDTRIWRYEDVITVSPYPSVGGVVVPVDRFGLLAPYIGIASTILAATVATTIYIKRVKRRR